MYAQVTVPSFKGPADSFTYEVPAGLNLLEGQMVTVPFGKVREVGIVWKVGEERLLRYARNDKKVVIKPIDSLVFEKPFLLPYQLELLDWMSSYYLATKNNCTNAMLPELPARTGLNPAVRRPLQGLTLQQDISRSSLVISQTLVLVPTINHIPQTMALFPKATTPIVFHSDLKPHEKLAAWLKVLNGQADYIFGTRQATFLPFPNLRKIIIINEHDDAYKDQRSPYYDTLTVAEKISQLTGAELKVIDPAPRVATYYKSGLGINLSLRSRMNPNPIQTRIVSMIDERKAGNKTSISDELRTQIGATIKNGGHTLLYLNKKKESGTLYCNNCRYQEALEKEPENCPNCASPNIFFASFNINSLAKQVKALFPKAIVNLIADNRPGLNPELSKGLTLSTIDIATSAVFYRLLPKHYDLVAAVAIDGMLNAPEFTSAEKTYALVNSLKRLARKKLVIQTYSPENRTVIAAANSNYRDFYTLQLKERKALAYPPFGLLIKLVVKSKTPDKAESLADNLKRLTIPDNRLTILGPFEPYFRKKTPSYNIILKMALKNYDLKSRLQSLGAIAPILDSANASKICNQIIVDPNILN